MIAMSAMTMMLLTTMSLLQKMFFNACGIFVWFDVPSVTDVLNACGTTPKCNEALSL
jgi:hypothetical protein